MAGLGTGRDGRRDLDRPGQRALVCPWPTTRSDCRARAVDRPGPAPRPRPSALAVRQGTWDPALRPPAIRAILRRSHRARRWPSSGERTFVGDAEITFYAVPLRHQDHRDAEGWAGPTRQVRAEEFVVATAPETVLPGTAPGVRIGDLADQQWVHYTPPSGLADVLNAACEAAGFQPQVAVRTEQAPSALTWPGPALASPCCRATSFPLISMGTFSIPIRPFSGCCRCTPGYNPTRSRRRSSTPSPTRRSSPHFAGRVTHRWSEPATRGVTETVSEARPGLPSWWSWLDASTVATDCPHPWRP